VTVLCLHGAYGAPGDFDAVCTALAAVLSPAVRAAAGPVVVPWLPGHDPTATSTMPELSKRWGAALQQLTPGGSSPVHLVGYSLGARLALALSLRLVRAAPARLASLTLVAGTAGLDDENDRHARAALDDERASAFDRDPAAFLKDFWRLPVFGGLASHPAHDAALAVRVERAHRAPQLSAWLAGLSVGRMPPLGSSLPALVGVPVALVVGARDDAYRVHAARIAAALPHATTTTVNDAGHALLLEAPDAVAAAVAGAIESAVARAGALADAGRESGGST
jgi:2-succinyl-6-hydroxy-2,4-cyclohexadiene-1-carboxylate synthase